jgi:ferredoxin
MLVINPDECIDCGVCEPECPAEAIIPDTAQGSEQWVELNRQYAAKWPNVTRKGIPPSDADDWLTVKNKLSDEFSPNPGKSGK